jgi:DNA/RNA-binding domain of Phe-tRNA-synthetase-like protein
MPHVSNLVDVGNWVSLDLLLPLGLYDSSLIRGPVVLRRGETGDGYDAINHAWIDLDGRYLLADDEGPFGSPMTDSLRTAVTESTTAAVFLVYAPMTYDSTRLSDHGAMIVDRVQTSCDGAGGRVAVL